MRARHYAPETGRFLTRDTWSGNSNRPLSFNRWGYVEDNPINYVDPLGRWALDSNTKLSVGGFYKRGHLSAGKYMDEYYIGIETDIFVPAFSELNDIEYLVYDGEQPNVFPSRGEDVLRIERIGETIIVNDYDIPPIKSEYKIQSAFLNPNWKIVSKIHRYSTNFGNGASVVSAFTETTTSPNTIHDGMDIGGVEQPIGPSGQRELIIPETYGELKGASQVQALDMAATCWRISRENITREYWIFVEQDTTKNWVDRATIVTINKQGQNAYLWFDEYGWHEEPFYYALAGK